MTDLFDDRKSRAAAWFRSLRDQIVTAFEAIEDDFGGPAPAGRFDVTPTTRPDGGGGLMSVMRGGRVFEKIGVNVSAVHGTLAERAQKAMAARGVPVVSLMAWGMFWGVVASAGYAIFSVGAPVLDPRPAYLAGIAYLGIVGSALTFPLYSQLIREWGPGPAAYNGVAVPVVAMILSTLFEGYQWSLLAGRLPSLCRVLSGSTS